VSTFNLRSSTPRYLSVLSAAAMALILPQAPVHAGGDITNFNVRNCTQDRAFVCSFDETDSLMNVPYKARGIQPGKKKDFGCASLGKCKVIIGVSKRTSKKTLSVGMEAGIAAGAVALGAGAGAASTTTMLWVMVGGSAITTGAGTAAAVVGVLVGGGVAAAAAGGAIAGIEIADGWKDGDVCRKVKNAARKAGLTPKRFMRNGKAYQIIEKYATDKDGNLYLNQDGTAMLAYETKTGKGSCPAALQTQIISN
jgi:hypothetical protein